MRTFLPLIALAFAGSVQTTSLALSLEVIGYVGDLGEWELTANLAEQSASGRKEFAGPLTMRHTGVCSVLEPEEKTGEIRLWKSGLQVQATLLIGGAACSYSGKLGEFYSGVMSCPDRAPAPLKLWLK
jgi:hypothetical protein